MNKYSKDEFGEEDNPTNYDQLVSWSKKKNLLRYIPEEQIPIITNDVLTEFQIDRRSQQDWRQRMERGIELASLVKKSKTYPFSRAANIRYPLVTTAAQQFNARAYPQVIPPDGPVKVKVNGSDPKSAKQQRANRVQGFYNHQLQHLIPEWEPQTDQLLMQLPIVGTMFRKVWYDTAKRRPRTRLVKPGAFVVNNNIDCLADAPRYSEELSLFPDEIRRREKSGLWRRIRYADMESNDGQEDGEPDKLAAKNFIEQHRLIDIDGDGILEPYIVTVNVERREIVRIVADYMPEQIIKVDDNIIGIFRNSYYIDYHFTPSIDGKFMSAGLGILLGDISDGVNSLFNLLLDAGHMASLGSGFLGSGFRDKGGPNRLEPGKWKMMQTDGATLKDNIVPMEFPGADPTLYQMLGMLIESAREVASVKDVLTGEISQNMTATTTMALIEQGLTVFTAVYKRIYHSLQREYRLIGRINAATLDNAQYSRFHDIEAPDDKGEMQPVAFDAKAEFESFSADIEPVADPRQVTKMQKVAEAEVLRQMVVDGLLPKEAVARRMLEAMGVEDIEKLLPEPTEEEIEEQKALKQLEIRKLTAEVENDEADVRLKMAEAAKFEAEAKKFSIEDPKYTTDDRRIEVEGLTRRFEIVTKALVEREDRAFKMQMELAKIEADMMQEGKEPGDAHNAAVDSLEQLQDDIENNRKMAEDLEQRLLNAIRSQADSVANETTGDTNDTQQTGP